MIAGAVRCEIFENFGIFYLENILVLSMMRSEIAVDPFVEFVGIGRLLELSRLLSKVR